MHSDGNVDAIRMGTERGSRWVLLCQPQGVEFESWRPEIFVELFMGKGNRKKPCLVMGN